MVSIILKLVAFSVAKKALAFGIAKMYGIPRLYRRIAETHHRFFPRTPPHKSRILFYTKYGMRLPRVLYDRIRNKTIDLTRANPPKGQEARFQKALEKAEEGELPMTPAQKQQPEYVSSEHGKRDPKAAIKKEVIVSAKRSYSTTSSCPSSSPSGSMSRVVSELSLQNMNAANERRGLGLLKKDM
jgi:hypothetical protein